MKKDSKTIYAQSSDIKSRTYLEYRRDMKRKAIAELEVIEWLQQIFQQRYPGKRVSVFKSGGDAFLWFLREGGISREPDFIVEIDQEQQKIEFQYADTQNIELYDFKISKISIKKKKNTVRTPKKDVLFLYIDKPTNSYALLDAQWIHENGQIDEVPAWRTQAYRVPAEKFQAVLKSDPALEPVLASIDDKNIILRFQYSIIDITRQLLAQSIVEAIENRKQFIIAPDDLEGFFRACFIMESLQNAPEQTNEWLEKAIGFTELVESLKDAFQTTYCLDFLYFRISPDETLNSLERLTKAICRLIVGILLTTTAHFAHSLKVTPVWKRDMLCSLSMRWRIWFKTCFTIGIKSWIHGVSP